MRKILMVRRSCLMLATFCVLAGIGLAAGPTAATDTADAPDVKTANLTTSDGLTFTVRLDLDTLTAHVEITNPTSKQQRAILKLVLDKQGRHTIDEQLPPGQTETEALDIRGSIDSLRDIHNVSISTFGNATTLSFHHDVNLSDPEQVPIPQITNVTVANGTIQGNASTVAYVRVTNPTNQLYSMKLMVHSLETGGGWYPASVNRSDSRTIKAVLFEDRGTRVAGEARLYINEPSNASGALDQVEFVGRAGEPTQVYNRSYQPVRGPWTDDPYQYENESLAPDDTDTIPGTDRLPDLPRVAYGIGALIVVAGVLLRRRG
jgi:hypothetical protein